MSAASNTVRYHVVARPGRNRGIYAAYGAWEHRVTDHHGWGTSIYKRDMTREEIEGYSKNHRLSYTRYDNLDDLLDDERRVLADTPEEFTRLRDSLTSSSAIKQFHR